MYENLNTEEMDLSELQDDPDAVKVAERLPQPAIVRAAIVGVVTVVGAVLGHQLDVSWLNPLLDAYTIGAPIALGFWFHRKTKGIAAAADEAVEEYVGRHRKT